MRLSLPSPPKSAAYTGGVLKKICAGTLILLGALSLGHVARAVVPDMRGSDVVRDQLGWLAGTLPAAAPEMQELFPEGELFMWLLPGLAAGAVGGDEGAAIVERAWEAVNAGHVARRFGTGHRLEWGTFYRGWRLLLMVERARLAGDERRPALLAELSTEATAVLDALRTEPVPTSYPGRSWPCDAVVAMAGVHRAAQLVELSGLREATEGWFDRLQPHRDAAGLLVHEVGSPSARGSSQAIIQVFLPDIDARRAAEEWPVFRERFVSVTLGLVGVREHPKGIDLPGDVDSGPLINGVSASASAVTLAAARRNGDHELIRVLDREADLLGLPLPTGRGPAYAFGLLPVGDAFLAWARSTELAPPTGAGAPQPVWWLFWLAAALPGALGGWWLWRLRASSRSGRLPAGRGPR